MNFDNFVLLEPERLLAAKKDLPATPAVYLVLLRGGDRILELSDYFAFKSRLPRAFGGYVHMYTGATNEWGRRVLNHVAGDCWTSTLRRTLVSLETRHSAVSNADVGATDILTDLGMTEWLRSAAKIAVMECTDPFEQETRIIHSEPTPLNIDRRRLDPYARVITAARDAVFPRRRRGMHGVAPKWNTPLIRGENSEFLVRP